MPPMPPMSSIRLLSAFGGLLLASASAQAAAPVAAHGMPSITVLGLDLQPNDLNYVIEGDQPEPAPLQIRERARGVPAGQIQSPHGQLRPQPIDDRGVGYRLWF